MASIRKRKLPSGVVRFLVDYTDGAGNRRAKQFETRAGAVAYETRVRHEISVGTHTPDSVSVTFADAAKLWLRRCEANGRERSTLVQYRAHVNKHLVPLIGAEKLSRLTTPRIEGVADGLTAALSRVLARKVLVSLKSIFRDAQRRGLIAHNPSLPVRIETSERHKERVAIPSKPELRTILDNVKAKWRPLVITAMLTGLRTSELRALTWDHVDLDERVIRVRQRADAFGKIGAPKSKAGRRDVPLSPMVVNTLREWRLACPKGASNLVFPNTLGGLMHAPDILRRCWYPLMRKCGLLKAGEPLPDSVYGPPAPGGPLYDFHHLRHAAASLLIEQGAQPKRIQEIMGHSSIKVTFDIYGHLFADAAADQALVSAVERRLLG
jgi:integrase